MLQNHFSKNSSTYTSKSSLYKAPLTPSYLFSPQQNESRMGKLMSKNSEGQNLPYIPDNTLAQLTVKELNKKVRQMETQVMITLVKSHDEQRRRRKSL